MTQHESHTSPRMRQCTADILVTLDEHLEQLAGLLICIEGAAVHEYVGLDRITDALAGAIAARLEPARALVRQALESAQAD